MELFFTFNIRGQPKERPRFAMRGHKITTYTAPKTKGFENYITVTAKQQLYGKEKLSGKLAAFIDFNFETPKKTKLLAPKPDIDNLQKAVFDALNEIAYDDDTQIVEVHAAKKWSDSDQILLILREI